VYAVIEVAGKQFRVAKGDSILIDQPESQAVTARALMVVDGTNVTTDAAKLKGAMIATTVTGTVRDKAERVMKFQPKQGRTAKRMLGHRRTRTRVVIDSISL
jgi:large subunit ribosomal protein L21